MERWYIDLEDYAGRHYFFVDKFYDIQWTQESDPGLIKSHFNGNVLTIAIL